MGTRGMFGFFMNGVTKGAYNHFDSYPSGKGVSALEELRIFASCFSMGKNEYKREIYDEKEMKNTLVEMFDNIKMIDNDASPPTDEEVEKYRQYLGEELIGAGHVEKEWYALLRDVQGSFMPYLSADLDVMLDGSNFILDSLFCEWAYIINIDDMTFEVWKGFQHEPWMNNRYGKRNHYEDDRHAPDFKYYPCKLFAKFSLFKLPTPDYFVGLLHGLDKDEGDDFWKGTYYPQ